MREDDSAGFWVHEQDLLNLIKICDKRHKYYYTMLIEAYEVLEGKKFHRSMIQGDINKAREYKNGEKF